MRLNTLSVACEAQGPRRGFSLALGCRANAIQREKATTGTRGREIGGIDGNHMLKLLNQAYASEWLAYYQYWLGAKLIKGPMKDAVAAEPLLGRMQTN
jgi:hypothetical protein